MSTWDAVAADGTDPDRLARAVALAATSAGHRLLDEALRAGTLPRVSREATGAAERHRDAWVARGVRVALRGDAAWPRLRCATPPPLLAWRGAAPRPGPSVALVGARRATGYGRAVAAWLAGAAADAGVVVVSGGAVGIDAAAHGAAAGAGTVVVLGCGHDVAYPKAHARHGGLFDEVLAGGGTLLTERLPGEVAHPGAVRARNRIVAGLVDAVVVVEGGATSGSLLTASAAADAGVTVLAVPGDVRAPGSVAPHRLLAEGAAPCTDPSDLLAAVGVAAGAAAPGPQDRDAAAGIRPAVLGRELAARWPRPASVGALADATGLTVGEVLAATTRAVVAGLVVDGVEGVRLRRAPS